MAIRPPKDLEIPWRAYTSTAEASLQERIMGWAYCGKDSTGREIGYGIAATCDEPGCQAPIDRGLAYACGGMHGATEIACEKYFCQEHLQNTVVVDGEGDTAELETVCNACKVALLQTGDWVEDEEEGAIVQSGRSGI